MIIMPEYPTTLPPEGGMMDGYYGVHINMKRKLEIKKKLEKIRKN